MGAVTEGESLKVKYREALIGFEQYSFTEEQIYEERYEFDLVLKDLKACKECDGELCRTITNHRCSNPYYHQFKPCTDECYPLKFRGYYALWHKGCRQEGRPVFALFPCPGPAERKELLLERVTSKRSPWWDK